MVVRTSVRMVVQISVLAVVNMDEITTIQGKDKVDSVVELTMLGGIIRKICSVGWNQQNASRNSSILGVGPNFTGQNVVGSYHSQSNEVKNLESGYSAGLSRGVFVGPDRGSTMIQFVEGVEYKHTQ